MAPKFFHANATIKHRKNLITSLIDSNGHAKTAHASKADILWTAYKERLGMSEFQHMVFNLSSLFPDLHDLSVLEEPFSQEEIDQVVANLPSDKSHGPDGFNTDFVKKDAGTSSNLTFMIFAKLSLRVTYTYKA